MNCVFSFANVAFLHDEIRRANTCIEEEDAQPEEEWIPDNQHQSRPNNISVACLSPNYTM